MIRNFIVSKSICNKQVIEKISMEILYHLEELVTWGTENSTFAILSQTTEKEENWGTSGLSTRMWWRHAATFCSNLRGNNKVQKENFGETVVAEGGEQELDFCIMEFPALSSSSSFKISPHRTFTPNAKIILS